MRRRHVSDEELNQVIKLKQAGASWLNIQVKTGVPRRSAKRAYEDWERQKSLEELRAARVQVATEAFREHIEYIIRIAEVLVDHLPVSMPFYETRDAQEVLSGILMTDTLEEPEPHVPFRLRSEKEQQRIFRQNEMILQSLKDHTREKVRWQVLGEWRHDWNDCMNILANLRKKAGEVVLSRLNDQEPNPINRIKDSIQKDVTEDMITGVVEAVWRGILAGKPEDGYNLVHTKVVAEGHAEVLFGEQASITAIELPDSSLAGEVANVSRQAAQTLCQEDLVQQANSMISTMQTRIEELEVMLNQLTLRPMILRTRCELCPA